MMNKSNDNKVSVLEVRNNIENEVSLLFEDKAKAEQILEIKVKRFASLRYTRQVLGYHTKSLNAAPVQRKSEILSDAMSTLQCTKSISMKSTKSIISR